MDKIQIYTVVLLILEALAAGYFHEKERPDGHLFYSFLALIFCVPILGRIFGWW